MATTSEIALSFLSERGSRVEQGYAISPKLPWRAHLYERKFKRAWYCHDAMPESDGWIARLHAVKAKAPHLNIGIAGPSEVLTSEKVLLAADDLNAHVLPLYPEVRANSVSPATGMKASACDFVFEDKLRLSP